MCVVKIGTVDHFKMDEMMVMIQGCMEYIYTVYSPQDGCTKGHLMENLIQIVPNKSVWVCHVALNEASVFLNIGL